jgi:hypothetical protein
MIRGRIYFGVVLQVFLLVSLSFSFSYIFGEAHKDYDIYGVEDRVGGVGGFTFNVLGKIVEFVFSDVGLASAAELSPEDFSGPHTCPVSNNGSICQQFIASQCEDNCAVGCIPNERGQTDECRIGTCFDPNEGTCLAGSPKAACTDEGGEWFNDPNENVPICREGCCVINGEQTFLGTARECEKEGEYGKSVEFLPEIDSELACLALGATQEEGACTFSSGDFGETNTCRFTTHSSCLQIGGQFSSGFLCSHPDLNTNCEAQDSVSCIDGKDEVYWLDSCGNRENIYDINKVKSLNNYKILSKQESCSLGDSANPLENQESCGSCNYVLGNVCGAKTEDEKLSDSEQDFVCKSLDCVDSQGQIRRSGESWCAYQGAIGLSDDEKRSRDTPGSRHFRETCFDGEVREEACQDYRNEICVESQELIPDGGGDSISFASCRINRWQECLEYNSEEDQDEKINLCNSNPDCYINQVNVDSDFNFNICAPKYPAGFDLDRNLEGAESICGFASQRCTSIFVKKLSGKWKCESNCNCEDGIFAEELNDLCISLGDCGAIANFNGDLSESYRVSRAPGLSQGYLDEVESYSEVRGGEFADPGNLSQFLGSLGIPGDLGKGEFNDPNAAFVAQISKNSGAAGTLLTLAANTGTGASLLKVAGIVGKVGYTGATGTVYAATGTGFGGALSGVLAGAAAASLVIQISGVSGGLPEWAVYGLIAVGTGIGVFAGTTSIALGATTVGEGVAAAGVGVAGSAAGAGSLFAAAAAAFIWAAVIVGVIVGVLKLLGTGKTRKKIYEFQCKAWQAPFGGSGCYKCGADGFPCSEYACKSLGQTCEFINKGTGDETCVDINPNDLIPPRIKLNEDVLAEGQRYENIGEFGFKIVKEEGDGCVGEYEQITIGVESDEPMICASDFVRTTEFDEMSGDFGRGVFLREQTQNILVPSLDSLGVPGFDPDRRADLSLYVRCKDKSGNEAVRESVIEMCVGPGNDISPPRIRRGQPVLEDIRFDSTGENISIYTSEPAECRWDLEDKDYEFMESEMFCANDLDEQTIFGWQCFTEVPVVGEKNIYNIRCLDQPWLNESEKVGDRRSNSKSLPFNLTRSSENLKIVSISPMNETLVFKTDPATVEVIVKTEGGVDGNAQCFYEFNGNKIPFLDTYRKVHRQPFNEFLRGNKELNIVCEDVAGNVASETSKFRIEIDTNAPDVTRAYVRAGNLFIGTNEDAECRVSKIKEVKKVDGCGFNFEDGEKMSGTGQKHTLDFEPGITHYVKCKDELDNVPGRCSIILKG